MGKYADQVADLEGELELLQGEVNDKQNTIEKLHMDVDDLKDEIDRLNPFEMFYEWCGQQFPAVVQAWKVVSKITKEVQHDKR